MENKKITQTVNLDELHKSGFTNVVAAIGVFDGIHLGHRKLICTLLDMAKELSAIPIIITFFPHPRKVLMHDENLRFLRTPEKKLEIMWELGIKAVVTVPFTFEFASLPPEKFIEHFMMPDKVSLKGICVGSKWRFGKKASGNVEILHKFMDKFNFKFAAVNELHRNEQLVSSTAIRNALKRGDFETANSMLDCIYSLTGEVEKIVKQPNLYSKIKVFVKYGILPPLGQYTVYIKHNGDRIKAYANVTSEENLYIFYPSLNKNIKTIEFDFIDKI
jgi:riboflavin kinase / FMN adenylyltransferase